MTQIIPIGDRTHEQIAEENDRLRIEAEISQQEIISLNTDVGRLKAELADARATIERRDAVIKILEQDIEAIGAGGVSSQPISGSQQ